MEPLDLLSEIGATNDQIREVGRERLELVERFNHELRDLIRDFESTPDTFREPPDASKKRTPITLSTTRSDLTRPSPCSRNVGSKQQRKSLTGFLS